MKQDRFLIGILVFIGILVITALLLFFINPTHPAYLSEADPEGVVNNYLLAIQDRDLDRAYSYLADLERKPSKPAFSQAILNNTLYAEEYAVQVVQVEFLDEDEVWVLVSVQYLSTGPFETGWSNQDHAALIKQQGAWKITYMPYPYWGYEWYQSAIPLDKP